MLFNFWIRSLRHAISNCTRNNSELSETNDKECKKPIYEFFDLIKMSLNSKKPHKMFIQRNINLFEIFLFSTSSNIVQYCEENTVGSLFLRILGLKSLQKNIHLYRTELLLPQLFITIWDLIYFCCVLIWIEKSKNRAKKYVRIQTYVTHICKT